MQTSAAQHAVPHIILLRCAVLCCTVSYCAVLCCAVLCGAVLCCGDHLVPMQMPTSAYAATQAPSVPASTPSTTSTPSSGKPYSWLPDGNYLTTVRDQIVDQNNNPVTMHGVAWYGFGNSDSPIVEGLTQAGDSQVHRQ